MGAVEQFLMPEPVFYYAGAEGFAFFGAEHLVALTLSIALIVVLALRYRDSRLEERARQQRLMAGAAVALLALKDLSYVALGLFDPLFWPLHICNFCEYLAVAAAFAPDSRVGEICRGVLICWGLLGCTGALLFPGWSYYTPALSWANVSGFLEHSLVLACVVCMAAAREEGPTLRDVGISAAAAVVCGVAARFLNPLVDTNFFFVTRPANVGGPFPWALETFGDPGFLAVYLGFAVAFWLAVHLVWRFVTQSHESGPSESEKWQV